MLNGGPDCALERNSGKVPPCRRPAWHGLPVTAVTPVMEVISGVPVTEVAPGLQKETDELSAFDPQKAENYRYRSQTLESVKHHLKPSPQRSAEPRQ